MRVPSPLLAFLTFLGSGQLPEDEAAATFDAMTPHLERLQSAPHVLHARVLAAERKAAEKTASAHNSMQPQQPEQPRQQQQQQSEDGEGEEGEGGEDAEGEEEGDGLDAGCMFPDARGLGVFLLQSAMNHACAEAATAFVTTSNHTELAEVT